MQLQLSDWDKDLPADPEEEYEALVRSLSWIDGFGLIFVRCSPAEAERLIVRVKKDVSEKNIEVLRLKQPIDNFYELVDSLANKEEIDILFVKGLEYSLYGYEELYKETKLKDSRERYGYSLKGVPRVLGHLNLQRENFRDNFNICFVFILPIFGLKYFIRRAPDFFDWRSGVFEFPTDGELLEKESVRIIGEGDYEKYRSLTTQERSQKILEIEDLLAEENQTPSYRVDLLLELGKLFAAGEEYEEAIASLDRALQIKPDDEKAWYNRGNAMLHLGRYEETIASFDSALNIKPDYEQAWNNRGVALFDLKRYEEALASFDRALQIKPKLDNAWYNRGNALSELGRYEEAIGSYEQALKLGWENELVWNYIGNALFNLGRYEEAIASLDRVLQIKPDNDAAWYNRGVTLSNLKRYKEAIGSFDSALQIKSQLDLDCWRSRGDILINLEEYKEAIESYDRALEIKKDNHYAWHKRGIALQKIGRYEEAVASYKEALKNDINCPGCWIDMGVVLKELGRNEEAIASLDQALKIKLDNECYWHKGNALFNLGRYEEAIASYDRALQIKPDYHEAWYLRGVALGKLGRLKEAMASFNKVAEIKPDFLLVQQKEQLKQMLNAVLTKLGFQKLTRILKGKN